MPVAGSPIEQHPPALLYLWDRRTLYLGPLHSPARVSLAAARLIVSLQGDIRCKPPRGREFCCKSLLLPAGVDVRLDTGQGPVADCHLDAAGFDYAVLQQLAAHRAQAIHHGLIDEPRLIRAFTALHRAALAPETVYARLDRILNPPELAARTDFHIDARVLATIQRIKRSAPENLSVDELAAQVDLSSSRLASLFKQQVGIPIRRYRLWRRLYQSTISLARGMSLTDAALDAGFTDSAHFSRTYRAILGMRPSAAFIRQRNLRIHTTDDV